MSMCTCRNCTIFIDSDEFPECFVEIPKLPHEKWSKTIVLCENCREEFVDENGSYWPEGVAA